MMLHDESRVWQYAARELDSADARLMQHHLTECPDCQDKLTDVRTALGALKAARRLQPVVDFERTDALLSSLTAARTARSRAVRPWLLGLGGGLVAAGVALMVFGVVNRTPAPSAIEELPPLPVAAAAPRQESSVEKAQGLYRVGAEQQVMAAGTRVASGDVLKTAAKGEGVVRLSEGSRLTLSSDTQLSLTRAESDEVALTLERGKVAIGASHAQRKGFVVHASGLMVRVVGTVFSVANTPDGVEVAVAQGRVAVEPPDTLPVFVNAGQRARFDTRRWRMAREKLSVAQNAELMQLATVAAPERPAVGGHPAAPTTLQLQSEPRVMPARSAGPRATPDIPELPRALEPQAPVASPNAEPAPGSPPLAPAAPAAPAAAAPAVEVEREILQVPLLSSPVESVGHAPAPQATDGEWEAMPTAPQAQPPAMPPAAVEPPAAKSGRLADEAIPEDAEAIFLQRAEHSLTRGTCQRYLLGLDELASDVKKGDRAERARVARARCFDASMKPREASDEYRRYLESYPAGRWAAEARQILSGE